MNRVSITPDSHEHWLSLRAQDITSTEVSALFGISPYITHYGLWQAKRGALKADFSENDRMRWGTRLQDAIAAGICTDEGWQGVPMTEYMRLPEHRIGCSFDWNTDHGLLEIKNVDSLAHRETWLETDDGIEAPVHIEMQVQHQMLVSGIGVAYIGALIGGNRVQLLRREADPAVHDLILRKVRDFWASIASNQEPAMVFPADADVVSRLYGYAEPGSVKDFNGDPEAATLLMEYQRIGREIKELEAIRDEHKAHILMSIGSAEKAYCNNYTVSAGMVAGAHIEYDRKPYRAFRVTSKKEKSV